MAKRKKASSKATFKAAVEATPSVAHAYKVGIQALEQRHRDVLKDVQVATGSIALDDALVDEYPNANRWDYGIGLPHSAKTERVLWLEPHHAGSGETKTVINKLAWLKAWLRDEAPALDKLPRSFVWLVSSKGENPNDRRRRTTEAEKHGLKRAYPIFSLTNV